MLQHVVPAHLKLAAGRPEVKPMPALLRMLLSLVAVKQHICRHSCTYSSTSKSSISETAGAKFGELATAQNKAININQAFGRAMT